MKTTTVQQLLEKKVSLFKNVADSNRKNSESISIRDWFGTITNRYANNIRYCRKLYNDYLSGTDDKTHYQNAKKKLLPLITPSCLFNGERNSTNNDYDLTGIMCIDIDGIESPEKVEELKYKVIQLPYCFVTAKSVSGYGFFALIAYDKQLNFKHVFNSIRDEFDEMGIKIDLSCSDYTRLRFIGLDDKPLVKRDDVVIQIYDKTKIDEPTIEMNNYSITDDLTPEEYLVLISAIKFLVDKCGYGSNNFLYDDEHKTYNYDMWLKDGYRLSALDNTEIGYGLFMYISKHGEKFSSQYDVNRQFNACRYGNQYKTSVIHYFALCKKILGDNWKEIIISNSK